MVVPESSLSSPDFSGLAGLDALKIDIGWFIVPLPLSIDVLQRGNGALTELPCSDTVEEATDLDVDVNFPL